MLQITRISPPFCWAPWIVISSTCLWTKDSHGWIVAQHLCCQIFCASGYISLLQKTAIWLEHFVLTVVTGFPRYNCLYCNFQKFNIFLDDVHSDGTKFNRGYIWINCHLRVEVVLFLKLSSDIGQHPLRYNTLFILF